MDSPFSSCRRFDSLARAALVVVVALTGLAFAPCPAPAAEAVPTVLRTPAPAWVERTEPDLQPSPPDPVADTDTGIEHLLRDEQVHVAEQTTYRHFAFRFLSPDGVQDASTLTTAFNPTYETLAFHQLVIRRGAETLDRLPRQEIRLLQRETNLESQLYDGQLTATIILDDVRPGDVVEYAYSLRGANPVFQGHAAAEFSVNYRSAMRRWRERILWPANRPLPHFQTHATDLPTPAPRPLPGGVLVEYRWAADHLPARPSDGDLPGWVDPTGWVQLSDYASWNEVARWAAALFGQTAPGTPEAPARLPAELERAALDIEKIPARPARAVAALRYVQDNIRYLGIEIGANTHQPYPIATVSQRRFGDCKDKANLLCALLRRLGFEADPALVETDYRGTIGDWHPTPFAFNHCIVRLAGEGGTFWLDPTREHQGGTLGHLFGPAYGHALVVRADTTGLADVPPAAHEESAVEIADTYRQTNYGDPAVLTVHTVCRGLDADRMRGTVAHTGPAELQRQFLNFYARQHPTIRALAAPAFHDDLDKNELLVDERYEVADFWGEAEAAPSATRLNAAFRPRTLEGRIDRPATRLRTMPFRVDLPSRITETIEVQFLNLPHVQPEHVEIRNAAFAFDFTAGIDSAGNLLRLRYGYEARADSVPAARTAEYLRDAARALEQLEYTLGIPRGRVVATRTPVPAPALPARPNVAVPARGDPRGWWWPLLTAGLLGLVAGLARWGLARRARAATSPVAREPLHRCAVCGRDDLTHPELEFRVGGDGRDYCEEHATKIRL